MFETSHLNLVDVFLNSDQSRLDVLFTGGHLPNLEDTPRKTYMEPENGPLEEEIPFGKPSLSGSMLIFGSM